MQARTITAIEHQVLPVGSGGAALSPAEAERLAALGLQRRGFCALGHRSLRLSQFVGLVSLGNGRVLEILPKVGEQIDASRARGTLLRLLRWAYDLPSFAGGGVDHGLQQRDLLDVFVLAYLRTLVPLVRAGLVRRYRSREENLGVVRGRLLLKRQFGVHAMRVDRIACRFDDLTTDNPWNQVLKAALVAVRPWARGLESGRLWLEMAAALDEVHLRSDGLSLHRSLRPDRQVNHYRPALRWAGWILQLLSPDLRSGANSAPELLFDMNRLFELAMAMQLRRRANSQGLHLHSQHSGRYLARHTEDSHRLFFGLRPDLILSQGETILAVADTKWSRLAKDKRGYLIPADAHAYQLNAYAAAYPCDEAVLIYPWHEGLDGARMSRYRLPGSIDRRPVLHIVCADVEDDALPLYLVKGSACFARLA
jgi:5-methylcytosine-specific restriction enzyme subunit McrC